MINVPVSRRKHPMSLFFCFFLMFVVLLFCVRGSTTISFLTPIFHLQEELWASDWFNQEPGCGLMSRLMHIHIRSVSPCYSFCVIGMICGMCLCNVWMRFVFPKCRLVYTVYFVKCGLKHPSLKWIKRFWTCIGSSITLILKPLLFPRTFHERCFCLAGCYYRS